MAGDELTAEDLERLQRAEREELEHAQTDAEADTHERRADKAAYLRQKLAEQQEADRQAEADRQPEPEPEAEPGADAPPPAHDGAGGH